MALLSGEVETGRFVEILDPVFGEFRMALLSGEVETRRGDDRQRSREGPGSGWLCYPGKLKHEVHAGPSRPALLFRMALLSGEVETSALLREEIIDG